jgi:hypothetical protein
VNIDANLCRAYGALSLSYTLTQRFRTGLPYAAALRLVLGDLGVVDFLIILSMRFGRFRTGLPSAAAMRLVCERHRRCGFSDCFVNALVPTRA